METYLGKSKTVPFADLYLDPNNPRLAPNDPPGYQDPARIFDKALQAELESKVDEGYDVESLEQAIVAQGWMPIDNIVVWEYPDDPSKHIVVEGNRRTVTLRRLRKRLEREREKLERMRSKGRKAYAADTVASQERLTAQLERIVADTDQIQVLPLDAENVEELQLKLPRLLAVRHITGAREWGNYAEDLWLLGRYQQLFGDKLPEQHLQWKSKLIERVAAEASLASPNVKRRLKAAIYYSHFKAEWEDQLPEGEEFKSTDYYLFENIVKKPWLRSQFSLGEDDLQLPDDAERTIFEWGFKLPRGRTAEDNKNIFYRHENVLVWEKMHRYDDKHGTGFAQRFDVTNPDSAPRMAEVEAEYMSHKSQRQPTDIIDQLLRQLDALDARTLRHEGSFVRDQLEQLGKITEKTIAMIDAAHRR